MDTPILSLAMTAVDEQIPRRGSMSAAYLQVASTGVIDAACRLFAIARDLFLTGDVPPGTLPDLDSLRPEALGEKLLPQLAALQELKDPGQDHEQQESSLRAFQEVHADLPTDLARDVTARAKAIVSGEMDHVRAGLRQVYGSAPNAVQDLATTVRTTLARTRVPDPNWKPLTRWAELKRIGDKLRQRRGILPASTVKAIQESLTSEAHNLYGQTLHALAIEKIAAAWKPAKAELIDFLDDLSTWSAEVVSAFSAVKKCLEDARAAIAADQQVSRASVVRALPGPTDAQVIAGMLTQVKAADETELARTLLGSWEARLREVCPQVCAWINRSAPLPDLLRGMPPAVQEAAFRAIVEQAQGPGQSLYEILDREGLQECAEFLYHRSEPTVHLSGRDMSQLGLSPQRFCIVTLPKPIGPKDGTIQGNLIAAFEKIDPNATFAEAPPTDRTVTAIRLLDGFVIGIEGQNHNLLNHYLYAAEQGHRPHLFDIVLESPDGKAVNAYLALNFLSPTLQKENNNGSNQ